MDLDVTPLQNVANVLFAFIIIALPFVLLYIVRRERRAKDKYHRALKGTDTQAAVSAGRAYYQLKGEKDIELRIANDLKTMEVSEEKKGNCRTTLQGKERALSWNPISISNRQSPCQIMLKLLEMNLTSRESAIFALLCWTK